MKATDMTRITVIISAGIAAYKTLELVRLLRKAGHSVVPVMTKNAGQFITPLSLEVIAEHPVYESLFTPGQESEIGHIQLARQSDLIVIAPASAYILAQYALGLAEDLPTTMLLANTAPVLIAPAMNHRMWQAEATQNHIATLQGRGVACIGPNEGDMACGEFGIGRMAEPAEIVQKISEMLQHNTALAGKRILVTGGPTFEAIDPVRYIANRSSGKQAGAIVRALVSLGAEVVYVHGPITEPLPSGAECHGVESAQEMYDTVSTQQDIDVFIAAAAVADWRVKPRANKIKKGTETPLELLENPDILAAVAQSSPRPRLVIGFAAETDASLEQAKAKLHRKGCDWLLLNAISAENPAFGADDNHLVLLAQDGGKIAVTDWGRSSKEALAQRLCAEIVQYFTVDTG